MEKPHHYRRRARQKDLYRQIIPYSDPQSSAIFAPMDKKAAFLFDLDGTVMDNMQYHLHAWEKTVAEAGSTMQGDDLFKELYGKNTEILTRVLGTEKFSLDDIKEIALRKDALYRETYAPHIAPINGFREFLEQAHQKGVGLAIASGTITKNVDFALDHLKIRDYFGAIVSGSDVKVSKPDPDTFLKAAEGLNILPSNCIVFEDVPMGVEAARRAGMKAVVILTSHSAAEFEGFDNVLRMVSDYNDLNIEELLYLVTSES